MDVYHVICDESASNIIKKPSSDDDAFADLTADPIGEFTPPPYRLSSVVKPLTNFFYLNDTALIYDEAAARVMEDFEEYAGELFSIEVDSVGTLTLVNVLEECNALNGELSKVVADDWQATIAINSLHFHKSRISSLSSLFKLHQLSYRPILTVSNASNEKYIQEHDFYKAYHKAGLTGLRFDLLWSDTQG